MKFTYIAVAAALAQVCIAGTAIPCTASQNNACLSFQIGISDTYYCVCTASPSCSIDQRDCYSQKYQLCKNFYATKQTSCNPGVPCPVPTECSKLWIAGVKTYKCTQFQS